MEIELTQGYYAWVDDENYVELNSFKWHALVHGTNVYAVRFSSLRDGHKITYMHHSVIGKPPKGFVTDHINGCGVDNRRINLQFITQSENIKKMNRNTPKLKKKFLRLIGIL